MNKYDNIIIYANSRSGHSFITQNILSWLGVDENITIRGAVKDIVVNDQNLKCYNFENRNIQHNGRFFERFNIDVNERNLIFIQTRDYLNWLASSLMTLDNFYPKIYTDKLDTLNTLSIIWLRYAKEIFGETNFIPSAIKINYDCFRKYDIYRKEICDEIGGKYTEKYLNVVHEKGYYSSFDGDKYQNEAYKMKVDERYLQILETEYKDIYLESLRQNKEALFIYAKYFNIDQNKKEFIRYHCGEINIPDKKCGCSS